MFTKIKTKEGKEFSIVTQQYVVGTYVIINNNPALQFGVKIPEEKYHLKIRTEALKNGDTLLAGSILTYNGKLPINEFKPE